MLRRPFTVFTDGALEYTAPPAPRDTSPLPRPTPTSDGLRADPPAAEEAAAALKEAGFELRSAKDDPRPRVTGARWSHIRRAEAPTAADLARLRELPHLTNLSVCSVGGRFVLDGEAAGHLAGLQGVDLFATFGVEFRPGTLARVAKGLPGLTMLDIGCCRFAGEDLDAVGGLPGLHSLNLAGTEVTDADLGRLRRKGAFPELKTLYLFGCEKVTAGGVAALRKARPGLRIYGDAG
jgi:hypothetical protein